MTEIEVTGLRAALFTRREEMEVALQPDFDAAFDVTAADEGQCVSPLVLANMPNKPIVLDESKSIPPAPVTSTSPNSDALRRRARSGDDTSTAKGGRSRELQLLYDEASVQFPRWVSFFFLFLNPVYMVASILLLFLLLLFFFFLIYPFVLICLIYI
jgi:hypothetical protein